MSEGQGQDPRKGIVVQTTGHARLRYTQFELTRDLGDISGSFTLDYDDLSRTARGLPALSTAEREAFAVVRVGQPFAVIIDFQTVMTGWISDVVLSIDGDRVLASISGFDTTAELVDCSANPEGPAEYRGLTLDAIARELCRPFGISVVVDTNMGDPFDCFGVDASEPVMSALEKGARARGVLMVSDGLGNLMLTRAGTRRGPVPLRQPGNIHGMRVRAHGRGLFSDYWVKGQARNTLRGTEPALSDAHYPSEADAAPAAASPTHSQVEMAAIANVGHAVDAGVARYRPRVWLSRTQSGGSEAAQRDALAKGDAPAAAVAAAPAVPGANLAARRAGRTAAPRKSTGPRTNGSPWTLQDQAEWRKRTARANTVHESYVVVGWRAGPDNVLWRPNQLVLVQDRYSGIDGDQLIAGVRFLDGSDGGRTELRIVRPDAYDLTGDAEAGGRTGRRVAQHAHAVDATARRLR